MGLSRGAGQVLEEREGGCAAVVEGGERICGQRQLRTDDAADPRLPRSEMHNGTPLDAGTPPRSTNPLSICRGMMGF